MSNGLPREVNDIRRSAPPICTSIGERRLTVRIRGQQVFNARSRVNDLAFLLSKGGGLFWANTDARLAKQSGSSCVLEGFCEHLLAHVEGNSYGGKFFCLP